MHRGVQTIKGARRERLLIALAMLGLLFMPIEYRAGADHPHAHALIQLFAEAAHGAPRHHQAAEHTSDHQAQDRGDRRGEYGARSMTFSDVDFPLWAPEPPAGRSPANPGVNALWSGTTVPTELPSASLMTIEVPDVPESMELTATVVTHHAALTGVLIVDFALVLVRRILVLANPWIPNGTLPQPEPPPPRLHTLLYV